MKYENPRQSDDTSGLPGIFNSSCIESVYILHIKPEQNHVSVPVSYTHLDVYKRRGVHVSGTEDAAYYYSSYHITEKSKVNNDRPKIMILGGGPNRIG